MSYFSPEMIADRRAAEIAWQREQEERSREPFVDADEEWPEGVRQKWDRAYIERRYKDCMQIAAQARREAKDAK